MNGGVRRWTHGPSFEEDGVRFRLWAPAQKRLALALESRGAAIPMERRDGGLASPPALPRPRFTPGGPQVPPALRSASRAEGASLRAGPPYRLRG